VATATSLSAAAAVTTLLSSSLSSLAAAVMVAVLNVAHAASQLERQCVQEVKDL